MFEIYYNLLNLSFFVLVDEFLEFFNFCVKSLYIVGFLFLIRIEFFSNFVVKDLDVIMLLF